MTFTRFVPSWRSSVAAPVFLLAGAVLAQAPDVQVPQPDQRMPRQPTSQSVRQQEDLQGSANKSQAAMDRRFRDMDRQLNRTMRSVCNAC